LIAAGALLVALIAGGCGGGEDETAPGTVGSQPEMGPAAPPAADIPDMAHSDQGGAAGEASPEASPTGPEAGQLSESDEEEVTAFVRTYVAVLNERDAEAVCGRFAPGALRIIKRVAPGGAPSHRPVRRGGCVGSLRASIGARPAGGGPAWKRTRVVEVSAVSIEGGGARATATVLHRFRDRRQPSIEEDVIYLQRSGGHWLLAKPSATFYRAVGYADPPLRALTPP
jgi:hypothetical protein